MYIGGVLIALVKCFNKSIITLILSLWLVLLLLFECGHMILNCHTDNVMLINDDDDSSVKLIDFGMMIGLEYPVATVTGSSISGTDGYFAPETLTKVITTITTHA